MTTDILVTLDLAPAIVDRIAAVDPSLRVRTLGGGTREAFGARIPYPSELQATTPRAEIEAAIAEADILYSSWAGALPDMDLAALAPRLRWVQLLHAGAERVNPALTGEVMFTSAAGMSAGPIAEWVIGTMLMFAKGWPEVFRDQQAHRYRRYMPREVEGSTLGIVGLGTIGIEAARRARALGCRVIGMRRSFSERGQHPEVDEAVPPDDLDYLLRESDYVLLSAPATAETSQLINARALRLMKRDAVLINVARGTLVDEAALAEALRERLIAGAALDVFVQEPLPPDWPLWDLDNLVMTPHVAAGTDRYYERATDIFCENLRRYQRGDPMLNVVDTARGY